MKEQNTIKNNYESPAVEICEVIIERGFEGSGNIEDPKPNLDL